MKFLDQRDLREKRLEAELATEKIRFVQATKRVAFAVQRDLVFENWLKAYPSETITLVAVASFTAGYAIAKSQMRVKILES
jgi:hypothetical protein